jgi:hypothetical protein
MLLYGIFINSSFNELIRDGTRAALLRIALA